MHNIHSNNKAPVILDATALKIRLHREKKARLAAEAIIEEKSHNLFLVKKEMELVLSGGIKMLTDVLALARPEVFQKAAKVQRWAKIVAPKLNVEKPWELDIAALLYPMGIIALPDELALKYALAKPLSKTEEKTIIESTQIAYELINNIEQMKGVAQIIRFSRKGYDGSGYPKDDIIGHSIPQSARVLKVLIDLADASTGEKTTRADGFMKMAAHKNEYDLDILKICYIELLEISDKNQTKVQAISLLVTSLKVGDIVIKDILDKDKNLLLASGIELSEMSIARLKDMFNKGRIIGKIVVQRD